MYLYVIPFHGQIIQFVHVPYFIIWWTFGLFLLFSYYQWSCYEHSCAFLHGHMLSFLLGGYLVLELLVACVLSLQSCPTLCNPMGCSLPGSPVHGLLQARILTDVGCRALLQGIFPTQGSNPCLLHLLHWQAGSLPLEPPGKPRIAGYMFNILKNY